MRHLLPRYRTFNKLEKAVFDRKGKTHIFCLTTKQKKHYQTRYRTQEERFTILPPNLPANAKSAWKTAYDTQKLRAELGISDTDFLLLSIASSFKTKGIDRTIKAFTALSENQKARSHLVIIGADAQTSYQRAVKKSGNVSHIHFVGAKDNVYPYLFAADLFLHPARKEAGGIVLLEALYTHTPIITTACCGYSDIIHTAHAGKVLPSPFNQTNYDTTLNKLLHPHVLKAYKENAKRYSTQLKAGAVSECVLNVIHQNY